MARSQVSLCVVFVLAHVCYSTITTVPINDLPQPDPNSWTCATFLQYHCAMDVYNAGIFNVSYYAPDWSSAASACESLTYLAYPYPSVGWMMVANNGGGSLGYINDATQAYCLIFPTAGMTSDVTDCGDTFDETALYASPLGRYFPHNQHFFSAETGICYASPCATNPCTAPNTCSIASCAATDYTDFTAYACSYNPTPENTLCTGGVCDGQGNCVAGICPHADNTSCTDALGHYGHCATTSTCTWNCSGSSDFGHQCTTSVATRGACDTSSHCSTCVAADGSPCVDGTSKHGHCTAAGTCTTTCGGSDAGKPCTNGTTGTVGTCTASGHCATHTITPTFSPTATATVTLTSAFCSPGSPMGQPCRTQGGLWGHCDANHKCDVTCGATTVGYNCTTDVGLAGNCSVESVVNATGRRYICKSTTQNFTGNCVGENRLDPGNFVLSGNNCYQLMLSSTCQLTVIDRLHNNSTVVDSTHAKASTGACHFDVQGDDNLVTYGSNGTVLWQSSTNTTTPVSSSPVPMLCMQNDGRLMLFKNDASFAYSTASNTFTGNVLYTFGTAANASSSCSAVSGVTRSTGLGNTAYGAFALTAPVKHSEKLIIAVVVCMAILLIIICVLLFAVKRNRKLKREATMRSLPQMKVEPINPLVHPFASTETVQRDPQLTNLHGAATEAHSIEMEGTNVQ